MVASVRWVTAPPRRRVDLLCRPHNRTGAAGTRVLGPRRAAVCRRGRYVSRGLVCQQAGAGRSRRPGCPGRRLGWVGSDEPGVVADDGLSLPPVAEAGGVAGVDEGEAEDGEGADDVVVEEGVVLGGQDDGPHHEVEQGAGEPGDADADAEDEGGADGGEAEHEQPVGPAGAGDVVVEALEGAAGGVGEEAFGGGSAVEPGPFGGGGVAQAEQFVEERPQERGADDDAQGGEDVAGQPGLGGGLFQPTVDRVGGRTRGGHRRRLLASYFLTSTASR